MPDLKIVADMYSPWLAEYARQTTPNKHLGLREQCSFRAWLIRRSREFGLAGMASAGRRVARFVGRRSYSSDKPGGISSQGSAPRGGRDNCSGR
jgi:hypothetical protein